MRIRASMALLQTRRGPNSIATALRVPTHRSLSCLVGTARRDSFCLLHRALSSSAAPSNDYHGKQLRAAIRAAKLRAEAARKTGKTEQGGSGYSGSGPYESRWEHFKWMLLGAIAELGLFGALRLGVMALVRSPAGMQSAGALAAIFGVATYGVRTPIPRLDPTKENFRCDRLPRILLPGQDVVERALYAPFMVSAVVHLHPNDDVIKGRADSSQTRASTPSHPAN
eukprot:826008-Pleurochrysis_carterae.AAC.1